MASDLSAVFRTAMLTPTQWALVGGLSLCPLLAVEGEKLLARFGKRKK